MASRRVASNLTLTAYGQSTRSARLQRGGVLDGTESLDPTPVQPGKAHALQKRREHPQEGA